MNKMKIYPVFIHFDPKNNKNIKVNCDFPETVDIPVFYDVSSNNSTMELSIPENNVKINDIIDKIKNEIKGGYLSEIVELTPFDDERTNFFFTNIDDFLNYYRRNRRKFWYLKYVFTCPFSLLFCHNNKHYADEMGRGFPEGGLILYIPKQDYPVNSSKCDYLNKLNELKRFESDDYVESFKFFDKVDYASGLWIDTIIGKKKVIKMLQSKFYTSGRLYDEADQFESPF